MADLSNVRVNGQRLWDALMEMAKIGATPKGGCKRLTLTDLDKQGRELFRDFKRSTILHQCFQRSLGRLVQNRQLMVRIALLAAVLFYFRKVVREPINMGDGPSDRTFRFDWLPRSGERHRQFS